MFLFLFKFKFMNKKEVIEKIELLKRQKKVIILAHYYVADEVQDIADFVGDSLELARKASLTDAEIIVLCGVHFMAETAKILSPNKKVLIPDMSSGCPLADSIDVMKLSKFKEKYPNYYVVNYVNTSAEVKSESDIICTSSNAVDIVRDIEADKIIFGPDMNLGIYVKNQIKDKEIVLWNGHCPIHQNFSVEKLQKLKEKYPNALVLAHPECNQEVLKYADFIGSTSKILNFSQNCENTDLIIATEPGIINQMKKISNSKNYIPLPPIQEKEMSICFNMKKHNVEKVLYTIENEANEIILEANISKKALIPITKMLEMSVKLGLVK